MSLISNLARSILFKVGIVAVLAGVAVIAAETVAGLAFAPTTARVIDIVQKCDLVDSSGRGIKYIDDGTCIDMAALKADLPQLELRPYRAARVAFNDKGGQEVVSTGRVAGLGVPNLKVGDAITVLYNPANPATVRGPASVPGFAYGALFTGLLMLFVRRQLT